jgi:hypothetical protein
LLPFPLSPSLLRTAEKQVETGPKRLDRPAELSRKWAGSSDCVGGIIPFDLRGQLIFSPPPGDNEEIFVCHQSHCACIFIPLTPLPGVVNLPPPAPSQGGAFGKDEVLVDGAGPPLSRSLRCVIFMGSVLCLPTARRTAENSSSVIRRGHSRSRDRRQPPPLSRRRAFSIHRPR